MFSAFQSNAFQRNAFQIAGSAPAAEETRGGFDERHYKRYRKHLERLTQVTSQDRRYPRRAKEAVEELQMLPVETTEIQKLIEKPVLEGTLRLTPEIDYTALNREIDLIRAYLDMMALEIQLKEQDDELALLLMMQ